MRTGRDVTCLVSARYPDNPVDARAEFNVISVKSALVMMNCVAKNYKHSAEHL